MTFRRIDGGGGADTLRLGTSMTLNLGNIANKKITGIERIDMVSTGPDREETIVLRHPFN